MCTFAEHVFTCLETVKYTSSFRLINRKGQRLTFKINSFLCFLSVSSLFYSSFYPSSYVLLVVFFPISEKAGNFLEFRKFNDWTSTLKVEATRSCQTLVTTHKSTRRHNREDHNLHFNFLFFLHLSEHYPYPSLKRYSYLHMVRTLK